MDAKQMIAKFHLMLYTDGTHFTNPKSLKMTPDEIATVGAAKAEILAELHRQEAEKAEEIIAKQAAFDAAVADVVEGRKNIVLEWHDGEYLSDYEITDAAALFALERLHLVELITNCGYKLTIRAADRLGHEFSYADAKKLADEIAAETAAETAAHRAQRDAAFTKARQTGVPQKIYEFTVDCDGSVCECSTDIIIGYAMPDGSSKEERIHTF